MQLKTILGDALMCCAGLASNADAGNVTLRHYDLDAIKFEAMQPEFA